MAEVKYDLKDVQEAIQDGLKQNKESILADVKEGNKATEGKVEQVLNDLKAQTEKNEQLEKAVNDFIAESKANKPEEKLNFKQALAKSLKENHESIKNVRNGGSAIFDVKEFNYTDFTNYEGFVTDYSNRVITNPYDSFHWRQIIPMGTTDKETISYPKEGATTGAADTWEHTGDGTSAKPEMSPSFSPYTTNVEWIAGLIKGIPISMLEDLPWLTSFLQTKAMNELMKAEDLQIKGGSGVAPDLDGFFTGTNSTAYDGSETKIFAQIIDAAYRQVADSNYNANKAVISNADKVSILLNTESGAGYNLPGGSVSVVNGNVNIAGLDLYSTSYLTAGEALIGDFSQSLFVQRSAPRLRFFEQNGTDAEKNQILARIEERVALAIFSSLAFVKIEPGT